MPAATAPTWPIRPGQDFQSYAHLRKVPRALWERFIALGAAHWPPPDGDAPWAEGVVTSITDGTGVQLIVNCGPASSSPTTSSGWVDGRGHQRWVNYNDPPGDPKETWIPVNYDLIIEGDPRHPEEVVRGRVQAQYPSGVAGESYADGDDRTLTIDGTQIKNAITGKFITDLSVLEGRNFYLIRSGANWSSDRFPELPNDNELFLGTVSGGTAHYPPAPVSPATTPAQGPEYSFGLLAGVPYTAIDQHPQWTVDQWAGKEALILDNDGSLHRVTIVHNDATHLYWTKDTSWQASGYMSIVAPGARGIPGRHKWSPFCSYAGLGDNFYTHMPDDTIRTGATLPARSAVWGELQEDGTCAPEGHVGPDGTAIDVDMQIPTDSYCEAGHAGAYLARALWMTIRSWQVAMLGLGPNYVKDVPSGSQAASMYFAARLLADLGAPSNTSTIQADDSYNAYFTASPAYGSLYWLVTRPDGSQIAGRSTPDGSNRIVVGGLNVGSADPGSTSPDLGAAVVWSAGPVRYWDRRVRYLYPKTCFVPDVVTVNELTGAIAVADPPHPKALVDDDGFPTGKYSSEGCGGWERREKSTHYAEFSDDGIIGDTGPAFIPGDLVRVVGDNAKAGTMDPPVSADTPLGSRSGLLLPYYDRFYRGKYGNSFEGRYTDGRSGTSTSGGSNRLTCLPLNWHDDGINGGAPLYTLSVNATSATGTTVTLHIVRTDDTSEIAQWLDGGRFSGDPYVGFVLNAPKDYTLPNPAYDPAAHDGTPATVAVTFAYKSPIRAFADLGSGGVKFTFDALLIGDGVGKYADGTPAVPPGDPTAAYTIAAGDTVTISEPRYELNKWEGRSVALTDPTDGSAYTATITHNDSNTLWFTDVQDDDGEPAGPLTVTAGWSFAIKQTAYGEVVRYTGGEGPSAWEYPTGDDVARLGVTTPQPFKADARCNLPTYVKGYGLLRCRDLPAIETLNQIYRGINKLLKTPIGVGWTSRADPETPETNFGAYSGFADGQRWPTPNLTFEQAKSAEWAVPHDPAIPDDYGLHTKEERATAPLFSSSYNVRERYDTSSHFVSGQIQLATSAAYAYPSVTATAGMAQIGCSVDVYAYAVITPDDPDNQDSVRVDSGDETGYPFPYHSQVYLTESIFDDKGSGVSWREWASVATLSYAGEDRGTQIIGPKVGNNDSDTEPEAVEPPPPDNPDADYFSDGENNAFAYGHSGYVITKVTGVAAWNFEYTDGAW